MTNYEKRKAMSVIEMAFEIAENIGSCEDCPAFELCQESDSEQCWKTIKKWLESEVEEDG
jgi:hypothetical protein